MSKIIDFLRYPSTWKGIIALLAAFGISISPENADTISQAAIVIIGLIWVAKSDTDVKPSDAK